MSEIKSSGFPIRIGEGHDSHRLEQGRKLILGGVDIPYDMGLIGHSDADVLLHAVIDALLGALALGDIGEHFPNSDEKYRGADSGVLLQDTCRLIAEQGWSIGNLDCTIFAEAPKLSPYKQVIRERIAELMTLDVTQVSVKAKTGEKVGPIGRGESISATVTVLLHQAGESS